MDSWRPLAVLAGAPFVATLAQRLDVRLARVRVATLAAAAPAQAALRAAQRLHAVRFDVDVGAGLTLLARVLLQVRGTESEGKRYRR